MEETLSKNDFDFVSPRWTVLVDEISFKALQDHPNYKIEASTECLFNPSFFIAEIVPTYDIPDIEAMDDEIEDVLVDTDALAIHEPFTNCVFVTEDSVEILSEEIYTWNNAGTILYNASEKTNSHTIIFRANSSTSPVSSQAVHINVIASQII